jgi:hypothetical protein
VIVAAGVSLAEAAGIQLAEVIEAGEMASAKSGSKETRVGVRAEWMEAKMHPTNPQRTDH